MLRLVILSALATLAVMPTAQGMMDMKMMHKIGKFNLLANCFGKDFMAEHSLKIYQACEYCESIQSPMYASPADGIKPFPAVSSEQLQALRGLLNNPALANLLLNRNKRALIDVTEEDEIEWMEDVMEFKEGMMTKMGNLSCVLTQLGMLDAAGEINMDHFSYDNLVDKLRSTPAGADRMFLRKMADGFSDCWDVSRAWPQKSLDRHPMMKKHGRHMIFFECAKKTKMMMCTKFELLQWLEAWYGPYKEGDSPELPGDKYDKAMMAVKVMHETASDEMKFVDDFFWGKNKM